MQPQMALQIVGRSYAFAAILAELYTVLKHLVTCCRSAKPKAALQHLHDDTKYRFTRQNDHVFRLILTRQ